MVSAYKPMKVLSRGERMSDISDTLVGLFIAIWIISWFAGIWIFHVQFFLTGIFAFGLSWLIYLANKEK